MAEYRAGKRQRPPTHPGAVLRTALEGLRLNANSAAPLIGTTRVTLGRIMNEEAAVTPEMALRLGKFFGNGAQIWLHLQGDFDLYQAERKIKVELDRIQTIEQ